MNVGTELKVKCELEWPNVHPTPRNQLAPKVVPSQRQDENLAHTLSNLMFKWKASAALDRSPKSARGLFYIPRIHPSTTFVNTYCKATKLFVDSSTLHTGGRHNPGRPFGIACVCNGNYSLY